MFVEIEGSVPKRCIQCGGAIIENIKHECITVTGIWNKSAKKIPKFDIPLNDGYICSKHNIGYRAKCPSCEFEKNMPLSLLIETIEPGQVAKAKFVVDEEWYITMTEVNQIRYCNKEGTEIEDLVPLTYSNLKAKYEIISQ